MKLREALKINSNGELFIDDEKNEKKSMVPTDWQLRRSKRKRTKWAIKNISVFSAYELYPTSPSKTQNFSNEEAKNIRTSIKHPKTNKEKKLVSKLIDISLPHFKDFLKSRSVYDIDFILPISSKSLLNTIISQKIHKNYYLSNILDDSFVKRKWKDTSLNKDYSHESPDSIDRAKSHLKHKQKNYADEEFQVHKVSSMGFRRYYDFLKKNDFFSDDFYKKTFNGKTILLVDDTMEEGATIGQAIKILKEYNPKEVIVYIFLETIHQQRNNKGR